MSERIANGTANGFRLVFAAAFSLILLNVIFNRAVYDYPAAALLLGMAAVLAALWGLSRLLAGRLAATANDRFGLCLAAMAAVLFGVEMAFVVPLRYAPTFDLEAIFNGAIRWVETGTFTDYASPTCHAGYFYIFPNNLGGLCFFYSLFRLSSFFGLTDYYLVASVANGLFLTGTMVLSACVARRLWSPSAGLFCGALFLLSPPFWFLAPVFYTDALSMLFPVAAWACCLRAEDSRAPWAMCLWYGAAGLCGGVGVLLKPTVGILLIALAIGYALRRRWRSLLVLSLAAVTMVALTQGLLRTAIYPVYLDRETAEERNLPTEYWLALGLGENGRYQQDVFELAFDPDGQEAKQEALRAAIAEEVREQGAVGLLGLFAVKTARAFGDGTYASSDFLDDRPANPSALHQWITYEGDWYGVYATAATCLLAALLVLAVVGVVRNRGVTDDLVAPISLFGLMLFLMVWEVSGRYFVNLIPMVFLAATGGVMAKRKPVSGSRKERPTAIGSALF